MVVKNSLEDVKKKLRGMRYGLFGDHSAVQVCHWTRRAIKGLGGCWKEKFYGVDSAGCCQMSPAVMFCENMCVHCWRPIEMNLGTNMGNVDNPKKILDGIVKERKRLLMGMKGIKGLDLKKFNDALTPKLYTMSLSGEPTLYPRLGEMFREIRKRGAVSFLVTNGLNPEAIRKLKKSELPTQITVSTNAPNERLFKIWHRSSKKNAWKIFNETLEVLKGLKGKVRRVIRLTLVKRGTEKGDFVDLTNMDDSHIKEYAKLIRKAEPDFIHVKGFKSIGYSRKRMGYDKQPFFEEVKNFAEKLERELKRDKYKIAAEEERSSVVMLAKKGKKLKITKV